MWGECNEGYVYRQEGIPRGGEINLAVIDRTPDGKYIGNIWTPKVAAEDNYLESVVNGRWREVAVFDDLEQAKAATLAMYYLQD